MEERELLRSFLNGVESLFDIIFLDCPPALGILTVNALVAARSVLIPVQCEYYAMEGLSRLIGGIERIQQSWNPDHDRGHRLDNVRPEEYVGAPSCRASTWTLQRPRVSDDHPTERDACRGSKLRPSGSALQYGLSRCTGLPIFAKSLSIMEKRPSVGDSTRCCRRRNLLPCRSCRKCSICESTPLCRIATNRAKPFLPKNWPSLRHHSSKADYFSPSLSGEKAMACMN